MTLNEPITNPTLDDCHKLLELLSKAWYLRSPSTHEPVPSFSDYHLNGVVVGIRSSRTAAGEEAQHGASTHGVDADTVPITGLWDFFRECAFQGFEGVSLDDHYPLDFFNRLTDMDRRLPTLVRMRSPNSVNDLQEFFFGRLGVVDIEPGTTVKWLDYEKLDKASNRYVLRGNPLPEPILPYSITGEGNHPIFFAQGATFLGPYVSDLGAVPIFSDEPWARYFAKVNGLSGSHQLFGLDRLNELASPDTADGVSLKDDLRIARVDLEEFLETIHSDNGPHVDIGLNPRCHRYRQGWFFKHEDAWMLQTISGIWELTNGEFRSRGDIRPYKSHLGSTAEADLTTTGMSTLIATPFKRITGADRAPIPEDDASALLDRELFLSAEGPDWDPSNYKIEMDAFPSVDSFVLDGFDKITGDNVSSYTVDKPCSRTLGFLVFPDIIKAAAFLIHEVLPHDEEIPLHGYHLRIGPGAPGSHNPDLESRITTGVTAAIRKTILDALINGYKPEHAFHLKRLIQDVTVTFEVTEIGYFRDLLFYGTADGGELSDRAEMEDGDCSERVTKIKAAKTRIQNPNVISPEVESFLRKSLGSSLDSLTPGSRVIAATIVEEFDRTGKRVAYDYSGISMKAAKLIERELSARVFRPWREITRTRLGEVGLEAFRKELESGIPDRTDTTLIRWLLRQGKLDIGGMTWGLKELRELGANTPVRELLADHLKTLPDGDWLLSPEFKSALEEIRTKYRNGGVHDQLVSYDVCAEAVEQILLGPDPLIKRLVVSTGEGTDK